MPSIDIIVPLLFVVFFIIYRIIKPSRNITYLVGVRVLIASLLIHLALRSWVWMIYPLFIGMALIIVLGLPNLRINSNKETSPIRKILWGTAFTISIVSFIVTALFPIRDIPEPTGNLMVGTMSWDINTNRIELYTDELGVTRSIRAQAWYPASAETKQALWLGDGSFTSQGLAVDFGFPGFIFNHLRHVKSHSYVDAPILDGSYPLVIISHGWSGFRQLHTDLAEELASHGFIVIGIEHTYGSVGTVFDNGVQVSVNREALPPRSKTPDYLDYANALVNTYAGDIVSVLDQIESYKINDPRANLFKNINLSSVTLIGHSTGGGAAVKVGITDSRISSVIGLDAWVEPLKEFELKQGLSIPSLLIRSEGWYISFNNKYLKTLIESSPLTPVAFQMNGTTHYDFGMVYMFSTLAPFIGLQGQRGLQMPIDQNSLILDYLNNSPNTTYNWQNIPDVETLVFP
jgi:alpha-beta hydrolase superfamily lysophospholipase